MFLFVEGGFCEAFLALAQSCLEDARKLDDVSKVSVGGYILIAHALELSLKAFLARRGLTEKKLSNRPYCHDLDRLYKTAVERGLKLSTRDAKEIVAWVNEYHSGSGPIRYALRYAASSRTLPAGSVVFGIIDAILQEARAVSRCSR
jgi:hypothetical protein